MNVVWPQPPATVELGPGTVHVWRASLNQPFSQVQHYWQYLSTDERDRAERFRFDQHRHRFVIARGVLRTLLGRYLDTAPNALGFAYGPHGKPALASPLDASALRFNVSHSHDCALFAFTLNREIGVDVEQVKPMPDADQISERFFSVRERAVLRALPPEEKTGAFFRCWARKEAVIKALGAGLAIPLDSFDVTLAPGEPARLERYTGDAAVVTRWSLRDLPFIPGFAAAVMVEGQDWQVQCWEWQE